MELYKFMGNFNYFQGHHGSNTDSYLVKKMMDLLHFKKMFTWLRKTGGNLFLMFEIKNETGRNILSETNQT